MSLQYVQLILDLHDGSGNLIPSGNISFTPSAQLTAPDEEFVPKAAVAASLNPVVAGTISLLATDNASVSPSGWGWNVAFYGVPGNPGTFSFLLPYSAGGTQYFSAQVPASTVSALQAYLPQPSGSAIAGYAPVASGSGQASAWTGVQPLFPAVTTVTADTAISASDYTVLLDATGLTATLPTAAGISGRSYTVKQVASGSGTVAASGTQTIDGAGTYALTAQYKAVTVQSDGTAWQVTSAV